jgi:hypothetical protein
MFIVEARRGKGRRYAVSNVMAGVQSEGRWVSAESRCLAEKFLDRADAETFGRALQSSNQGPWSDSEFKRWTFFIVQDQEKKS